MLTFLGTNEGAAKQSDIHVKVSTVHTSFLSLSFFRLFFLLLPSFPSSFPSYLSVICIACSLHHPSILNPFSLPLVTSFFFSLSLPPSHSPPLSPSHSHPLTVTVLSYRFVLLRAGLTYTRNTFLLSHSSRLSFLLLNTPPTPNLTLTLSGQEERLPITAPILSSSGHDTSMHCHAKL